MYWRKWLGCFVLLGCMGLWHCDTQAPSKDERSVDAGVRDAGPQKDTHSDQKGTDQTTQVDSVSKDEKSPDTLTQPEPKPSVLTYYKDIKNIVQKRCLSCHQSGGIGPFALETYKQVYATRRAVKSSVEGGRMPPWMGTRACNEYTNDISLDPEEKKKLLQWIDEGAVEGDPKDFKDPSKPPKIGLERIDLSLKMKKPYVPKKSPDDHRCFVLDWPHKTKKYITGFQIKAGELKMVHHVIAYLAHPEYAARYAKKDPKGDGYYCPGTAGGNAGINWLGVWAPGVPGGNYPKGTGLLVEPGSKIVVQIHYNTSATKPIGDQSTVQFQLEDQVKTKAIMIPFTNFSAWTRSKGMKIPKGEADVKHSFEVPVSVLSLLVPNLKELTIYSVMLHMHQLGAKGSLHIKKDAEHACLVDIPRWDFGWQLLYHLKKPITIGQSDSVGITCHFNNSEANQPIVNGKKQPSRDVYWGDGTFDEMCLGVLYVTCGSTVCPKIKF